MTLHYDGEYWYFVDKENNRYALSMEQLLKAFQLEHGVIEFHVSYIGQAYGKDGSRCALDRLLKHETLQKIALMGVPDGFKLEVLLLKIQPATSLFTVFNPWAQDKSKGE